MDLYTRKQTWPDRWERKVDIVVEKLRPKKLFMLYRLFAKPVAPLVGDFNAYPMCNF